jgi:hypothetical protein
MMPAPVELVALRCLRCETPVPAGPDEVAWVCGQCSQGLSLDPDHGLVPLEIQGAAGIPAGAQGRPFWVVDGQVRLQREAQGGFLGNRTEQAERFWAVTRRFFIPAFTCPLDELLELGAFLIEQQPNLQPGPLSRFQPVTLSPTDVPALAEFIVLAVEAGRKDNLKRIDISLNLDSPALWILP